MRKPRRRETGATRSCRERNDRSEHGEDPPFVPRGGSRPSRQGGIGGAGNLPRLRIKLASRLGMVRWRGGEAYLQTLASGFQGAAISPFGRGPTSTRWRHSNGARVIYGVSGRDEISLTSDQTAICLHGWDRLNAPLNHRPGGMQRGRAEMTISERDPLPRGVRRYDHTHLAANLMPEVVPRHAAFSGHMTHSSRMFLAAQFLATVELPS